MNKQTQRLGLPALLMVVALVTAACSSDAGTTTTVTEAGALPPTTGAVTEPEQTATSTTSEPVEEVTECDGSVEEIGYDAKFTAEFVDGEPMYFCVEVPLGVDLFSVELVGLSDDLDLYLGYPDLATVKDGGFGLKYSDQDDTIDEWVTVEIKPNLLWGPGAYYLEVWGPGVDGPSPFTLWVHPGEQLT